MRTHLLPLLIFPDQLSLRLVFLVAHLQSQIICMLMFGNEIAPSEHFANKQQWISVDNLDTQLLECLHDASDKLSTPYQ